MPPEAKAADAFFGVRNEDLPYNSERKGSKFGGPPPSLKEQGAMLLSSLTGVVNTNRKVSALPKNAIPVALYGGEAKGKAGGGAKKGEAECQLTVPDDWRRRASLNGTGDEPDSNEYRGRRPSLGRSPRPRAASLAHIPRRMSLGLSGHMSDRRGSVGESSFRSPRQGKTPRKGVYKDEACDTSDIPIDTMFVESDDELLYDTVSSLDLERQRVEDPTKRNKLALDQYMDKLKDSTTRLGVRLSMLHELATEDYEQTYSTLPPPPKARRLSSRGSIHVEVEEEEQRPTASEYVKQARRLVGSMNVSQQTNGLRDIHSWLQHLGSLSAQEDVFFDVPSSKPKDKEAEADGTAADWRLPSSPAMALQLAQEDLRNRLGSLYSERQDMLNRQAELMAATKLAGKEGEAEEARLREFLRRMHMLEQEYHVLGGKITENLTEAQKLDKRHIRIRKDVKESAAEASKDGEKGAGSGKGSDRAASAGDDERRQSDALKRKKKASKVEEPSQADSSQLDATGKEGSEGKKKAQRQGGEDVDSGNVPGAAATVSPSDSPTPKTRSARGSLVKATPSRDNRLLERKQLEDGDLEEEREEVADDDEKRQADLSQSVSKLLEDSDEEPKEEAEVDGPDFGEIATKRKKSKRRPQQGGDDADEGAVAEDDDAEDKLRRRRGKRRSEGESGTKVGSPEYDEHTYSVSEQPESKSKFQKDDRRRITTQRSALEWKILLESGQAKHRSCQTDPFLMQTERKPRRSKDLGRKGSSAVAQMDNKELRREIVRLKQRLRFWRARNWAEQHKNQPSVSMPAGGANFVIDDAEVPATVQTTSSETNDSRSTMFTPFDAQGQLQGQLQGYSWPRKSTSPASKSPEADRGDYLVHEEDVAQNEARAEQNPSFVILGQSPSHSPRDSRSGSLVPAPRSRVSSSSRSSLPLVRNSRVSGVIRMDENNPT